MTGVSTNGQRPRTTDAASGDGDADMTAMRSITLASSSSSSLMRATPPLPSSSFAMRSPPSPSILRLALVCILSLFAPLRLVLGIEVSSASSSPSSSSSPLYFVLIDAGSTGSRAHVHTYYRDERKSLPIVEESVNKKIKPGLSSYALTPSGSAGSIDELLAFIRAHVPESHWSITPIHLQATAGLRSITPLQAHDVLEVVRGKLSSSPFVFKREWARVISGEQEGINGWMAVNYLLGVFDEANDNGVPAGKALPSTGVVEMGGSSTQITFSPSSLSPSDRSQLTSLLINGRTYMLYTHSFLQYGLQAAEKLFQRLSISDIESTGNPCYPKSFRHSSVGDFNKCTTMLAAVVDKTAKCESKSCSFNGVYQPRIGNEPFVAIENFYYTAKFFGNDASSDVTPNAAASGNQLIASLRSKGDEFCNKDWKALRTEYHQSSIDELAAFCFSAAYQVVLLESGLGFTPDVNVRVAKTIGGKGIDWEMGATIFELMPKDEASERRIDAEAKWAESSMRDITTPGSAMMINSENDRSGIVRVQSSSNDGNSLLCPSCALYTFIFAVVVIAGYASWQRYSKRRSSAQMTSYSQVYQNAAGFNRV